jgi:Putative beta-barrel porin-2, OmpL-like. bbp2
MACSILALGGAGIEQATEIVLSETIWRQITTMRRLKSIVGASGLLLAMILMNHQTVIAQHTTTTGDTETVELRRRVKELEERLEKLETRQTAETTSASSAPTTDTVPAAEPAKPASGDSGILGFFKEVEVSGFVDGYYSYNFNKPAGRTNVLRNFDVRNNEFALNLAEIVIEKRPDPLNSRLGFRVDLDYGRATDMIHAAEPGGAETYKVIQQAYGSYLAPVGTGLQFDLGKFVTTHGAEVIESKDNWNYSRGLLFSWAIPYYHMGLRAKYSFNSKITVMGMAVNGWNNVEDNNAGKTFGVMVGWNPTSKLSIMQNFMTGPEQAGDDEHHRNLSDTTIMYTFNDKLAVMGNYDYGFDRTTAGDSVHWQGVAAYLRYTPTKKWAFSPRFEWFDDHDGFSTGVAQTLKEFTMTGEYKVRPNWITRVEYRRDWSDQPFFPKSDPTVLTKAQSTVLAGLIWTFGTREQ